MALGPIVCPVRQAFCNPCKREDYNAITRLKKRSNSSCGGDVEHGKLAE